MQPVLYMLLLAVVWLCAPSQAEPFKVTITGEGIHSVREDPSYFFENLLILSLEKTRATHGDYVLLHNNHKGGIARDRAMIIAGVGLDVMWGSATQERERQMRAVPIDLLKSLNNYRVLLIAKDAQAQFNRVKTLTDLQQFSAGADDHWTDTTIMRDNGFRVVTSSSYSGLFKMLGAHRFDFISRGLHEVGYETKAYNAAGLTQEKTLLLKYDTPIHYYFFVNKKNINLANRIERGLRLAQQDGSFDELFYRMPSFKEGETLLNTSQRNIIPLKNRVSD